jgi:putative acetyltransferase
MAAGTTILVRRARSATDEVRALIGELDAELAENYLPEEQHGLALDAIFQPHVQFFVASLDGAAVGCGGVALFDDFAEIKRMYVRRAVRGRGVADTIVARLTAEAVRAGHTLLRLETGTRQPAAIRLYERHGFAQCAAFEPYASLPPASIANSVFMEKQLAAP